MPAFALAALLVAASGDPVALADGVALFRGAFVPGSQPDGNTVMFRAPDGYVVVDTGRHAAHTQRIVDAARAGAVPVVAVVNTHWHLDHVGGNGMIRAAYPGLVVHASDAIDEALGGFLADYRKQLVGAAEAAEDADAAARFRTEIALIDSGDALKPDRIVATRAATVLGGAKFELGLEQAATAGDVWLYDPASRTLAAGDLVTMPVPFFDTACPARWRDALARLDDVEFERLVPGHGAPMSRAQFVAYRDAFGALLDCAASDADAGACVDGWLGGTEALREPGGDAFARELAGYYVGQVLRGDTARIAQHCRTR